MGWFDSEAVKRLKKASEFIGGLVADQAFGQLPAGAAEEMTHSESQRDQLKRALTAAAQEVGSDEALKKAMHAAGDHARMKAQVRSLPSDAVAQAAENVIKEMLAPQRVPSLPSEG